jgi:hypothetical protein
VIFESSRFNCGEINPHVGGTLHQASNAPATNHLHQAQHALAKNVFALPLPGKLHYALKRRVSLFGYKPAGTVKTTDRDQRPNTTDFFNISKEELHGITPSRGHPPQIESQTVDKNWETRMGVSESPQYLPMLG